MKKQLIDRLVDSESKAEILNLLHRDPTVKDTMEGLAKRIGREVEDIRKDVAEFVELGLLEETRLYSFNLKKNQEIQEIITSQLSAESIVEEIRPGEMGERGHTGVKLIDDVLLDGYPAPAAVLILGDPGSGKTTLCQQFLSEGLRLDAHGVYMNLDDFPDNIRQSMSTLGVNAVERRGNLVFIDCYSTQIGLESKEKYSEDPTNLPNLNIATSKALSETGTTLFIIDSMSTLIQKCGVRPSIEFLRTLVAKTRSFKASCLISLNRKAFHPAILASVQDMVDGVIELKIEDEPDGLHRYFRVSKMKGTRHETVWAPYTIQPQIGLVQREK